MKYKNYPHQNTKIKIERKRFLDKETWNFDTVQL